jgi:ADP-ribose pyrophosphatase YjhB (NUDIX family)
MTSTHWLDVAKRIQAIAQAGLTYAENGYDQERYAELQSISLQILQQLTDEPIDKIRQLFTNEVGYQTPKVDVRSVVFEGDKILMVKEKIDGHWSLPGGWADVGYTPNEVAVKEAWEETGLIVEAVRLLAVLDKKMHAHPPSPFYTYKLFILCRATGGALAQESVETSEVGFFDEHHLPPLSLDRITADQIRLMFKLYRNPAAGVPCD